MQHNALTLVGVSKRYGRRKPFVLRRIDAELEPGTIVHLQGSNGSGKSTLLRVIAGVSSATRGTITGRPAGVGFVPERFPPTLRFTPRAYLHHLSAIRRTDPAEGLVLLGRLGAALFLDTPMSQLSKGSAQKVALTQGLMGTPGLLVLDEAWTGLDAEAQSVLTTAVQQQAAAGGIVLLTDHGNRAALQPDRRWLIREGTVTHSSSVPVPPEPAPTVIVLTGQGQELDHPDVIATLRSPDRRTLTVAADASDAVLLAALRAGWSVHEVRPGR